MTSNPYGPDKPCQRSGCVAAHRSEQNKVLDLMIRDGAKPDALAAQSVHIEQISTARHNGGAHLDPADRAHYDGISISYNAAPCQVKEAIAGLLRTFDALTGPPATTADSTTRTQVEVAIAACLREIDHLGQLVAHVRVDADHRILDASRRALDCTDHGQIITGLERALTAADQRAECLEKARLALLGEHQTITDLLDARKTGSLDPALTTDQILTSLESVNRKTAAAHKRAFHPPTRKDTP